MHADELHKFSDGTLNDVRSALHDIVAGIRMKYLPMRKWSNSDKKRAQVMVQDIDKQLIRGGGANGYVLAEMWKYQSRPFKLLYWSYKVVKFRSKSENKGKVSTEMELVPEQTQQDASVMRTASAAAKPCQGDSLEFYLITGSIYTDDKVLKLKNIKKDGYTRFQSQEQYEHVGLEVTRSEEVKRSQDEDKRLCLVDDLKEV
ncbi:hypothetical protein Tco_0974110 [Tanacetum coccineum]|uniref:Uncharacterized protein n=1 Tax=Tanacetum coccineum TaxID=301880 RepID=A0ABQ5EAR4_9ASTR